MPLDLNEKVQKRLMTELDTHQLTVQQTEDRGKTLVTLRRIEEGEVIMLPSFLLFTDKRTVVTFLRRDDNMKHADAVLQVQGVLHKGVRTCFYLVLLGAARYLNDFQGSDKKSANCRIDIDPARGPNTGAVKLVVATRIPG